MLRRVAVALAFSTWCFLNCWVQLAQGGSVYYARYHPWRTVARPIVCWEILATAGMLAIWEMLRRRMTQSRAHRLFVALACVPIGIAAWPRSKSLPRRSDGWSPADFAGRLWAY